MPAALLGTALLMGLAGGPHCAVMCGATCMGAGARGRRGLALFHLGRLLGYAALGAVAAVAVQGLGWLATQAVVWRPLWTAAHAGALALGLLLLCNARQPLWLERFGRLAWSRLGPLGASLGRGAPFVGGMLWAFMPCGLLYSALLVAGLAGSALHGAAVMAAFALASAAPLALAPWLWSRLRGTKAQAGVRLAGGAMAVVSAIALWWGLSGEPAPWCVAWESGGSVHS